MSVLVERTPLVPRPDGFDGVLVEVNGMSALLNTDSGTDKLHRTANLLAYDNLLTLCTAVQERKSTTPHPQALTTPDQTL